MIPNIAGTPRRNAGFYVAEKTHITAYGIILIIE